MEDAKRMDRLRDLVPELLRQARDSRGLEAAVEADAVLWAIGKIEANTERVNRAFYAFDQGGYCENCKDSTALKMAAAIQGKTDE